MNPLRWIIVALAALFGLFAGSPAESTEPIPPAPDVTIAGHFQIDPDSVVDAFDDLAGVNIAPID